MGMPLVLRLTPHVNSLRRAIGTSKPPSENIQRPRSNYQASKTFRVPALARIFHSNRDFGVGQGLGSKIVADGAVFSDWVQGHGQLSYGPVKNSCFWRFLETPFPERHWRSVK